MKKIFLNQSRIEIAVDVLSFLREKGTSDPLSAVRISQALEIPIETLYKVLRILSSNEIIYSSAGRSGGFQIRVSQISLFEILEVFLQKREFSEEDWLSVTMRGLFSSSEVKEFKI